MKTRRATFTFDAFISGLQVFGSFSRFRTQTDQTPLCRFPNGNVCKRFANNCKILKTMYALLSVILPHAVFFLENPVYLYRLMGSGNLCS